MPGGNITGISAQQEEVLGKLIEILHEAAPRARRIAFLLNEKPQHMWRCGSQRRVLVPL
jgi:ABC-type uncharacterized transport system substrate-binding protein